MRLLFDTHVFLWWDTEPGRLSTAVLDLCRDPANTRILSVASAWEIQESVGVSDERSSYH